MLHFLISTKLKLLPTASLWLTNKQFMENLEKVRRSNKSAWKLESTLHLGILNWLSNISVRANFFYRKNIWVDRSR